MSIEAIGAALAAVREGLLAAHQATRVAQARLAAAIEILTDLGRNHGESLVPPQCRAADDQLRVGLAQLAATIEAIDRFVAGL